ncbi:MAG TPA: SGNH/GDSL hydrolase family protein, partial [Vicinamibacterales bacterium]|nr:SGNH/GDSL hydrolase family protein [Vicinamibacterales bacterium]
SGSAFALGTSDVICTATDAVSRTASCVFHVDVKLDVMLKGTRFLAFGDSLTAGEVAPAPGLLEYRPDLSYPTVLQQLLAQRYTSQTISMTNCGVYGNLATDDEDRLRSVLANGGPCNDHNAPGSVSRLAAAHFDALLLLEGTNDINALSPKLTIDDIVEALRTDLRHARSAGVLQVFLATLPPEFALGGDNVPVLNDRIRALAASEGAVLVDIYAALGGQSSTLIGVGGVHPTAQGYQVMAQTFFDAIRANFEQPPTTPANVQRIRR